MNSKILNGSLLFVAGFLFQSQANAQMFVDSGSYVFVNNEVVYVKQDLELNAADSNFYLRNEAQLLQGTIGAGANKGIGGLSVFQEGTSNAYDYNYWCSPVGGSIAAAGNSPFGITQLGRPTTVTATTPATMLAINNYNGTADPLAIAPYWIWKFLSSSVYSDWIHVSAASTIAAGEGFTMKGTNGTDATTILGIQNNPGSAQRYDFRGKPNDGTISIPVAVGQYTLTGNPYPSAIDLQMFLTNELNCTGIAYFWEQDETVNSHYMVDHKGGYGTYAGATGVYTPATYYSYDGAGNQGSVYSTPNHNFERHFSPIGQGFMIEGSATGTVEMKNSYRVFVKEGALNFSQFEKKSNNKINANSGNGFLPAIPSVSGFDYTTVSTAPTPQIRFNTLLNNQGIHQIALAFVPEATDGVDRAMDAASPSEDAPADVYFVLNNAAYVIDAINFDIDKKIPVGFSNTAQANYKITVKEILNFTEANNVYLHDKVANVYYDIKNSFYNLTLPTGVNNTQYEITFKNNGSIGVTDPVSKSFVVYQNNSTKNLMISNPLQIELASCGLYDVVGKLIFSKKHLGADLSYKFSTSSLSDGIYIVKITTKDKIETGKKIIVKN